MRGFAIFLLMLLLIVCLSVSGCTSVGSESHTTGGSGTQQGLAADKVEVMHFHPTKQCYSCMTLGDFAEKTVNESFPNEVASGRLVYQNVDFSLPENAALVRKYGVTGSSLWIGVYRAGNFTKEENVNVWYKIDNETDYKEYLTKVIRKRLDGT